MTERPLGDLAKPNQLTMLFSGDGRGGSMPIRQEAEIYFGRVEPKRSLTVPTSQSTPHAWVQMIVGDVTVLGVSLTTGDGLAIENGPDAFQIEAEADSQLLLFRLS